MDWVAVNELNLDYHKMDMGVSKIGGPKTDPNTSYGPCYGDSPKGPPCFGNSRIWSKMWLPDHGNLSSLTQSQPKSREGSEQDGNSSCFRLVPVGVEVDASSAVAIWSVSISFYWGSISWVSSELEHTGWRPCLGP